MLTIDQIQEQACVFFNLPKEHLTGPRRNKKMARARQISMYACVKFSAASMPVIGRAFGGRDHTTVMHARDRVHMALTGKKNLRTRDRIDWDAGWKNQATVFLDEIENLNGFALEDIRKRELATKRRLRDMLETQDMKLKEEEKRCAELSAENDRLKAANAQLRAANRDLREELRIAKLWAPQYQSLPRRSDHVRRV